MSEVLIGLCGLAALLVLFLTGIQLSFAMTIIGFVGYAYLKSINAGLYLVAKDFYDVFTTYGFTVLPLFILMGQLGFNSGIAEKLFETARRFVGHIPGGLALATVLGTVIFKAICGSSTATAATFASVAIPEMDRSNYKRELTTGIVASVGTLGLLIPPSAALIVLGILTQQSIGRLFMAGLLPGLLIALMFGLVIVGWTKIDPSIGPPGERSTWRVRFKALPDVFWALLIFIFTIGGIMVGFFTPTEAGSVGTCALLILCVVKEKMRMKGLWKSLKESLRLTCMSLMLIAGSTVLGHFIAITRIPAIAADWIGVSGLPPFLVMIAVIFLYLVGGSFIDDIAFMIFATPIFFPVMLKLGFDPVWFVIVICVTLMIGIVVPPVAMNVFIVANITKEPFSLIYRGVMPFLLSLVMCIVLLFLFPQLATWLPGYLMQ
ncbi:MAG: Sialic acid TRAP transporter permease protein SiaT [Syntrophorhabdaceae bacterium PtaU1.Bin034]|nr:MAG: Sialic acid TRAP transporter permease protein SiaT [Syntrophorhabdaceae bacterium PtaU1.Bin034]